eukprot:5543226-Pleurochrysis_carterae.AAC.2
MQLPGQQCSAGAAMKRAQYHILGSASQSTTGYHLDQSLSLACKRLFCGLVISCPTTVIY